MSEWITTTVGKLGKVVTGKTPSKNNPEDWGNEYLFITPSDYGNYNKSANHSIRGFSEEGYKRHKVRMIPKHSCLVTCIGSDMGKVVMNAEDAFCNQQINALIPNTSIIDSDYAYYFFKDSALILKTLGSDGTAVPILNKSDFEKIELSIPPLPEQKAIASVLSSLDDKIDLLHCQNKTLEAMAETLFRQWFIEEAKEDWEDAVLGDIATNVRVNATTESIESDEIYIGLEHIERRHIALSQHGIGSDVASNKSRFKKHDILFGKLRPYFHKVCIAPFDGICSTDILVLRAKKEVLITFTLFAFFQDSVVEYANLASGGTRMPRADWGSLSQYPIAIPPVDLLHQFNDLVLPSIEKIHTNLVQIQTLENLRDTLLPKLMSGEVRVQYQTEEVA